MLLRGIVQIYQVLAIAIAGSPTSDIVGAAFLIDCGQGAGG